MFPALLRLRQSVRTLLASQPFAGILLVAVAAVAIAMANSPFAEDYRHLLEGTLPWTPIAMLDSAHLWINDALMAVFFFVVGLEVKREMIFGNRFRVLLSEKSEV